MPSLPPLPIPLHQLEWREGGSDFPSENLVARNCSLQKLLSMPTSIQWACPRGYLKVPLYTDCSSPWPAGHHQQMRDRICKIPASLLLRKKFWCSFSEGPWHDRDQLFTVITWALISIRNVGFLFFMSHFHILSVLPGIFSQINHLQSNSFLKFCLRRTQAKTF